MGNRIRLLILADSVSDPARETPPMAIRLARLCDPYFFTCRIVTLFGATGDVGDAGPPCPIDYLNLPRWFLSRNPLARSGIQRAIRRFRPDCICFVGTQARLVGPPLARRAGIASQVVAVNDMGLDIPPRLVPTLRTAGRRIGLVVATSYASAQRLVHQEAIDRSRIEIIHHGIDSSTFPHRTADSVAVAKHRMGLSVHQPVILMAADLLRHKDHLTFLEAASHLQPLIPNARFVIIGHGTRPAQSRLQQAIADLNLSGRVTLTDDWGTLPAWMNAADVGVLTSYGESCSPTLLSYMASGLPVVAADVGGNSEIIQHNQSGYLVSPCEGDQLAVYTMILLLSPDLAERFGRAARKRIERDFTAEQEARRWTDYFRTLAIASA